MADISTITLPDNTGYNLKDSWSRNIIGSGSLNTTNSTIIPAINELNNSLNRKYIAGFNGITASTVLKITRSSNTQIYLVFLRGRNSSSWCNVLVNGYSGGSPRNAIISLGRGSNINDPVFDTADENDLTLKFTFNSGINEELYITVIPLYQNDSFTVTKE